VAGVGLFPFGDLGAGEAAAAAPGEDEEEGGDDPRPVADAGGPACWRGQVGAPLLEQLSMPCRRLAGGVSRSCLRRARAEVAEGPAIAVVVAVG
jgi:hypothetical protein